jgi:uncharacterized membrane protein
VDASTQPETPVPRCFVIQAQRSLSWRGNLRFLAAMATVSMVVAGTAAWMGAWPVIPFAGLEIAALAVCIYFCARRGEEREVVTIHDHVVEVQRGMHAPRATETLPRGWTQVCLEGAADEWCSTRLSLRAHGNDVMLGASLNNEQRARLAVVLRAALAEPG